MPKREPQSLCPASPLNYHCLIASLLLGVVFSSPSKAQPSAETIAAHHEATVSSINTLRTNFKQEIDSSEGHEQYRRSGTYLRSGGEIRAWDEKPGRNRVDLLNSGAVVRSVIRNWTTKDQATYRTVRQPEIAGMGSSELFLYWGFRFTDPSESRYLRLSEFYSKNRPTISSDVIAGKKVWLVLIERNEGAGTVRIRQWHDPKMGYLMVKRVREDRWASREVVLSTELSEWRQFGDVFVPLKAVLTSTRDGKWEYTHSIECDQTEVNGKISAAEMSLPAVPHGTRCDDHVRMKRYTIGSDWKSLGIESELVVQEMQASTDESSRFPMVATQPQENTTGRRWWWIGVALSCLAALALLVRTRLRKAVP